MDRPTDRPTEWVSRWLRDFRGTEWLTLIAVFFFQNCWLYLCGTKRDLISSGERSRDVDYNEAVNYAHSKLVYKLGCRHAVGVFSEITRFLSNLLVMAESRSELSLASCRTSFNFSKFVSKPACTYPPWRVSAPSPFPTSGFGFASLSTRS